MAFDTNVGAPVEIAVRLTTTDPTDIVDATDEAYYVPWVAFGEHNGSTPALTVALYDGTNSHYLVDASDEPSCWNALAMTAKQGVMFRDIAVPAGWKLRATVSGATVHAVGLKVERTAVGIQAY